MTNRLTPWLDQEAAPELRRLLLAARAQEPTRAAVQRVGTKLELALAAGVAMDGGELSSGSASASTIVGTKWALLGGGLVGVLAAGAAVVVLQRAIAPTAAVSAGSLLGNEQISHIQSPRPTSNESSVPQPNQLAVPNSPDPVSAHNGRKLRQASKSRDARLADARPTETETALARAPDSPMSGPKLIDGTVDGSPMIGGGLPRRAAFEEMPAPSVFPVQSQSAFIESARVALTRGKPNETLAILDQYERAYAKRSFDPEAMQLRMRAHHRLGNAAAAKQIAKTLVARYSRTPQGKEAREFLGE